MECKYDCEEVARIKETEISHPKVLIGGAPVSMAFCREIGADAYGIDARDAVIRVRELLLD